MKIENLKLIFIGLLLALGIFYLLPFLHSLFFFISKIELEKPLGAYFNIMVYLPLITAGVYVGFSKAEQKVISGAIVGIGYYLVLWLIIHILWPSPYFDHSFKPLIFGYGVMRDGLICCIAAWLTNTILQRRRL